MRSSAVGALHKYYQIDVDWKQSVIALTFADNLYVPKREQQCPNSEMSRHFNERLALWHREFESELVDTIGVNFDVFKQLEIYPT